MACMCQETFSYECVKWYCVTKLLFLLDEFENCMKFKLAPKGCIHTWCHYVISESLVNTANHKKIFFLTKTSIFICITAIFQLTATNNFQFGTWLKCRRLGVVGWGWGVVWVGGGGGGWRWVVRGGGGGGGECYPLWKFIFVMSLLNSITECRTAHSASNSKDLITPYTI